MKDKKSGLLLCLLLRKESRDRVHLPTSFRALHNPYRRTAPDPFRFLKLIKSKPILFCQLKPLLLHIRQLKGGKAFIILRPLRIRHSSYS